MMKGIIRRYIGEYIKNPHDFIVGANNPEVVFARDAERIIEFQLRQQCIRQRHLILKTQVEQKQDQ